MSLCRAPVIGSPFNNMLQICITRSEIVLLLSILPYGAAMTLTQYTDCGGKGIVHSFSLDICTDEPCHIVRNGHYKGQINFTAQVHSNTLRNELHGIFAGVPIPWTITPTDACGDGVHCPLQPGLAQVYTANVETPRISENTGRLVGKWQIKDENDRDVVCLAFGLVFNA